MLEQKRLDALAELDLIDSEQAQEFDEIVEIASRVCDTPIALITLLDEDRQWFKSRKGISVNQTARSLSFCTHALQQNDLFVIPDATKDHRFSENELVTQDPNIRFYAGSLIHDPNGFKLGTLCIIDRKPRELGWMEADTLKKLSHQVSKLIELRYIKKQNLLLNQKAEEAERQALLQKDRHERLVHLVNTQSESVNGFLTVGMNALTTGRFTKKEISGIVSKSHLHQKQLSSFSEGLRLLHQLHYTTPPAQQIWVNDLVAEILNGLQPLITASSNKFQPVISADFSYTGNAEVVRFVILTLLQTLLSSLKKTEIQFYVLERDGGIEIRLLLPLTDLTDALSQYMKEELKVDAASLSGRPFHAELALLKDMIVAIGGTKQVRKLGAEGTAIELFLPAVPA